MRQPVDSREAVRDETAERGIALYESQIRPLVEPEHNGKVVALHIDSGDYTLARFSGDAVRKIRKRHPSGELLVQTVAPSTDYGLGHRMRGLHATPDE